MNTNVEKPNVEVKKNTQFVQVRTDMICFILQALKEKNDNGEVIVYFLNTNSIAERGFVLTSIENIRVLNTVTEEEFIKSIDSNGEGFLELIKK